MGISSGSVLNYFKPFSIQFNSMWFDGYRRSPISTSFDDQIVGSGKIFLIGHPSKLHVLICLCYLNGKKVNYYVFYDKHSINIANSGFHLDLMTLFWMNLFGNYQYSCILLNSIYRFRLRPNALITSQVWILCLIIFDSWIRSQNHIHYILMLWLINE